VDGDRQSEVEWRRARNARARADLLREQAASERARTQLLTNRLVQKLREGEGRPLGDHGDTFSLRVARLPQAVALVRHELRRWLDEHGVASEDAVDITLACSEACANAVEHAGRPGRFAFEVEARRERDELSLAVHDFGEWTAADEASWRGRGLGTIRDLMDTVEIASDGAGTKIVMRRALRAVS
jgi:anti-sigma regulatory factor (Ser/Thr protein kinase)